MNDALIFEEIAAILLTGPLNISAPIPCIRSAQAAIDSSRPSLTVTGTFDPFGQNTRMGTLSLELRSRAGDTEEGVLHQVRCKALKDVLFGAGEVTPAMAKTAVKTAVLARGKAELIDYGFKGSAPDADEEDLVTVFTLGCVWRFL